MFSFLVTFWKFPCDRPEHSEREKVLFSVGSWMRMGLREPKKKTLWICGVLMPYQTHSPAWDAFTRFSFVFQTSVSLLDTQTIAFSPYVFTRIWSYHMFGIFFVHRNDSKWTHLEKEHKTIMTDYSGHTREDGDAESIVTDRGTTPGECAEGASEAWADDPDLSRERPRFRDWSPSPLRFLKT